MNIKKITVLAAVILTLYALIGFFLLPRLLRSKLVETISAYTRRPVELGKVSTNPFALSLTLRDFTLTDRDDERLVAFEELYVNFEASSLFRGGYAFSSLRLLSPYLRFLNRADGSMNLQDVMPAKGQEDSSLVSGGPPAAGQPAAPADSAEKPVTVFIDHLLIDQAEIAYEDRQRATPFVARIDSLDLSLRDFATKPEEAGLYQFEATTDRGEGLNWRGSISVIPFRSTGNLALAGFQARTVWEYIQDIFDFEITSGLADFQADYELDFAQEPGVFNLRNGSGAVQNLALVDRRESSAAATIPTLAIRDLEFDLTKSTLRIGEIESRSGRLFGAYLADSTLSLTTLFLPKPDPLVTDTSAPWQVTIGRLALEDYTFHLEDRLTTPFAQLEFTPLRLTMTDYVYGVPGQATQLDVAMGMKQGGRIVAQGTYVPEPPETLLEVQVEGLSLPAFQPYVSSMGKIELKSGTFSLAGRYHDKTRGELTFMDFKGDVRMESLRAVDLILNEDFLRWGRLDLKRVDYREDSPFVAIHEIVARGPYIRMIIGPDRITNIQHILGPAADTLAAADSTLTETNHAGRDSTPVTPTRIPQVRIIDGSMNFSDLSLTPNFAVGIHEMNGTIQGLSSEQLDSAVVDLNGKVDKYAPVTISGLINPLTANAFTDILMKFQSIELTTFTPYSGKFLGYKIDKGKLHLDLHYVLNGRTLDSENHIVLDQLTLGEKVESPDATSLPLKLAIGLLKDSKGVIDLDIPVKGSLDDPKFSVWPIVWKALLNLLVKAVTSPFKLLGSLFGGGDDEDLEHVSFSPGADSLATGQRTKLDSLAKALTERPGLKLDVRGVAAPALDREALAVQMIAAQTGLAGNGLDSTQVTKAERERLLRLYTSTFDDDPNLLAPEKDESGKKSLARNEKRRSWQSRIVSSLANIKCRRASCAAWHREGLPPSKNG
ncbi:MAG: DUF748 domain-containing protein [bacterium]